MKAEPFAYHAPTSVSEAVGLLAELGEEAKVLAGGQSLVPMLALRLAVFEHLVDINRVADFAGVERANGALRIGADVTETAVGASAEVAAAVPLLTRVTPYIGHLQIRNRGTLCGSVAHADPAAEYPAVALALDASMEVASVRGRRSIPAAEFFDGLWETAMEADELLTAVTFPVWGGRSGFAAEEVARRHGDFAIAGACVGVQLDGADRVTRCAIGLIGMGSTPERAAAAEAAAVGRSVSDVDAQELGRLAVRDLEAVPTDLHGSARFRQRVGATTVARAFAAAAWEAREARGD